MQATPETALKSLTKKLLQIWICNTALYVFSVFKDKKISVLISLLMIGISVNKSSKALSVSMKNNQTKVYIIYITDKYERVYVVSE